MPDDPNPKTLDNFLRAEARKLREKDSPPTSRRAWEERRTQLRKAMLAAMGPVPEKECPLEPKVLGVLKREGCQIERLVFQSRPNVWVTANAYVPAGVNGKVPAVLVVHGHWPWARRDPVVQARCLGLVKLGFFVLAVDAFGAGERYTTPGKGTYHGALYGSTLWPTGHTLLGMQVYDNRRAVDYLRTRPEVDRSKLGITGASGGGNQSMYAGALDERLGCVVPVCSVGTYQAYLHAACCVCEVLPGALRFTEEGDVLSLVALRALIVVNATKDSIQFSVGEAKKSLTRAREVFKLLGVPEKLKHAIFESPHAYNQEMREAMYGWMTRWLRGEGKGEPIPEPEHRVESPEDLACYPNLKDRPKGFLLLPEFAGREGRALVKKHNVRPTHKEEWEARTIMMRAMIIQSIFQGFPSLAPPPGEAYSWVIDGSRNANPEIQSEPGLAMTVRLWRTNLKLPRIPACILLHPDGGEAAMETAIALALQEHEWLVVAPDLRGTGNTKPTGDAIGGSPDHNSTEHALWSGRPLLGQWVYDVQRILEWLPNLKRENVDLKRVTIIGLGQAGLVALAAGAILDNRFTAVAALNAPISYVTDKPYAAGTRMGLLTPGILRVGDIPHLAALVCPRKLQIIGGVKLSGGKVEGKELTEAFAFTKSIYAMHGAEKKLVIADTAKPEDVVKLL